MKFRMVIGASILLGLASAAHAGLFLFAESLEDADIIAHPAGYTGGNNQHLTLSVCIHPDSESKNELEIPLRNSITIWNQLDPTLGNVIQPNPEMNFNDFDVESVLLHEVGHCIGLAHPNLASESGLTGDDARFAKTLKGPNDQYDLNAGSDGVIGTRDDLRGDDLNLNWFRSDTNDPFSIPAVIDASTYSNDINDLPGGHEWVEIAGRFVWQERGHPNTVAVMFQGIFNSETRRELNHDDVAMMRLGMTGTDRTQGTSKDYTYELQYGGIDDDCNITVSMEGTSFGFCSVSNNQFIGSDHIRIGSGMIQVASTTEIDWHFNDTLLDDDEVFHDRFEQ